MMENTNLFNSSNIFNYLTFPFFHPNRPFSKIYYSYIVWNFILCSTRLARIGHNVLKLTRITKTFVVWLSKIVRIKNSKEISILARLEILMCHLKGENYELPRIGAGAGIDNIVSLDNTSQQCCLSSSTFRKNLVGGLEIDTVS